jgi:sugar/nucleoside kinase (ribokinase family)
MLSGGEAMTGKYDVVLAGPISWDLICVGGQTETLVGGGVWYAAFPLATLGLKTALVTRLHPRDRPLLEPLERLGVTLFPVDSIETTSVENLYSDLTMETRTCRALACSAALLPENLPDVEARVFYGGALMRGEVPLETVRAMARKGRLVVDLQGYLRYRSGEALLTGPYDGMPQLLGLVHTLKADLAEAEVATGTVDPEQAARRLASYGPSEVLISGHNRLSVLVEGTFYQDALNPTSMAGRTGRGDTWTSTYVGCRLLGKEPAEALRTASRVTSLKVAVPGPYLGPIA